MTGQQVQDQHFPGGAGQPVVVISSVAPAARLTAAFRAVPGITDVTPPATVAGHSCPARDAQPRPPTGRPPTPPSTGCAPRSTPSPGSDALVGGNTAVNLDVQHAAAHHRDVIIRFILAVVFVILGPHERATVPG